MTIDDIQDMEESTTHPSDIKVGDILYVMMYGSMRQVKVIDEPFEIETLGPDDKGWWQCGIRYADSYYEWYIWWCEDNPVWEIGPA